MPAKTVYKVVYRHPSEGLTSALAPSDYRVRYIPGRKTFPRISNSLLFAFSRLESALEFRDHDPFEVWEAQAEGVINLFYGAFFPGDFRRFWNKVRPDQNNWDNELPANTVGCQSIRLVRKIEREGLLKTA